VYRKTFSLISYFASSSGGLQHPDWALPLDFTGGLSSPDPLARPLLGKFLDPPVRTYSIVKSWVRLFVTTFLNAHYCILFGSTVRVRVRIRVRIIFSVWLVGWWLYAHVFVLLSVVIVTLPAGCGSEIDNPLTAVADVRWTCEEY